jgi:predicted CoA-substrate-specific enzyme activase
MMEWEKELRGLGSGSRLGLDIGSRSTKYAFHRDEHLCLGKVDTTDFIFKGSAGWIPPGIDIVTTGYGRNKVPTARKIPEIRAHTVGVLRSTELNTFTLLDIGGQDFKVIRIENKGIKDFHMNDKCAAGTGRFLEKMAEMLHMDVDVLGAHTGDSKILESTCSVFTETELISLMMEGASKDQLAGGVIYSIYERVRPYLKMYPSDIIVLTGGVGLSGGLAKSISADLSIEVHVPEKAQYMGAIGSLYSRDR